MTENPYVTALKEWHAKFGVPILSAPAFPGEERAKLRVKLICEEAEEFIEAIEKGDIVGVAGELADLMYVVIGAALEWGIPVDPVFAEVHRANLSKVWPDGTIHYREDGKVLKPPTYSPADIAGLLARMRPRVATLAEWAEQPGTANARPPQATTPAGGKA